MDPVRAARCGGLASRFVAGFGPVEFDRAVYRMLGRTERWAPLGDGLRTSLRVGTVGGPRPAAPPFGGPDSRTHEAANRTMKCADGPGLAPGRVVAESPASADFRRPRRLAPLARAGRHRGVGLRVLAPPPESRPRPNSPAAPPVPGPPPRGTTPSPRRPVTPSEGARATRRALPGSRPVTLENDRSHGVCAGRGSACVDDAVAARPVDGTAPGGDLLRQGPGLPEIP
ncbi:alpha/beta hydrolase [Streptomyces aureoversilis]|uniref:Alpha/beta hydrolase n=1 Tax=Streptomyces aureoversilis TaxID=67277 RepID=A0ABV9ZV92_9ACTN